MQNDLNNNDWSALWKRLDAIPQHARFSYRPTSVNDDNLRFRASDLSQTSPAPTVARELATGPEPAVLIVALSPSDGEDAPPTSNGDDAALESRRKIEEDSSPLPSIPECAPAVEREEIDEIAMVSRDDLFSRTETSEPIAIPCAVESSPSCESEAKIAKGNCECCGSVLYVRSRWLNLCSACSAVEPKSHFYCVPDALEELGIDAEEKYHTPEDFKNIAQKIAGNVYVLSPYGYNRYNCKVEPDAPNRSDLIRKAKGENAIVLLHQGLYNHVVRAVRLSDLRCADFLMYKSMSFPLCAGAKKNLTILNNIAQALAKDVPVDKRISEIESRFSKVDRAKAIELYSKAQSVKNKNNAQKNEKKDKKKKDAPQPSPRRKARKWTKDTATEAETVPESTTLRVVRKPIPKSRRKKFGAAPVAGTALHTGRIYPVPRQDFFTVDEPLLVSPFTASDYEFTSSDFISDAEFEAARWNASDSVLIPFKNQVEMAAGMKPYDLQDVARTWARHIEGDGMMPPRFSDTITKKVIAESIITLDETNFIEGETVIIAVPNLEASKGALIFRKQPGTTLLEPSNLITAVIPQIDTEVLGPLQNVNASKLSVGIQQSTGADGSVAAFSNKFEGAVTAVSPLSAIPGKLSYATNDHKSISKMVTSETMVICNENYGVPDNLVKTGRAYDAQSDNVLIPGNGGSRAASAILRTGDSYAIVAGAKADDQDLNYGWQLPASYVMTDEDSVEVWKMSEHPSYLRHILFGSFRFTFCPGILRTDASATATVIKYLQMQVQYSDGTIVNYRQRLMSLADSTFTPVYSGSVEGYGAADENKGKLILDVIFSIFDNDAFSGTGFTIDRADTSEVHLEFDSVNAASTYSTVVISGAKRGQTIAVSLTADAEITIDPTGEVARYLVKPPTLCVDPRDLDAMFTILRKSGAHPYFLTGKGTSNIDFEAGDFGKKIKNFFKGAFRAIAPALGTVGRALGGAFGGPAGAAAGSAIGNAIGSLSSTSHGCETLLQICDSAQEYQAATFSGSAGFSRTGFVFPTVDTQGSVARLVDVVKGEGVTKGPDFLRVFNVHLSGSEKYTGKSCQLAFLCAALSSIGAPIMAGIYSGEVRNVHKTRSTATFELLPIGHAQEKLSTFGGDCMLVMTENGPTENGMLVDIDQCAAFSACTKVNVAKITPPNGFPDHCFRVSLIW